MTRLARLDLARQAGLTQFGEFVTYTPAAGGPAFPVAGVYSPPHEVIDLGAETAISTTKPVLGVDLADFTARAVAAGHSAIVPVQLDTLVRAGVTWRVADMHPDTEGGGVDLILHLV